MSPDDAELRLTRLEQDVAELREQQAATASDAAAARVLAAGADRDVSEVRAELRAHTLALNALRQTQLEQGRRLDGFERSFERRLDALDRQLSEVWVGVQQIVGLLTEQDGT